jgi:hypothetical protein
MAPGLDRKLAASAMIAMASAKEVSIKTGGWLIRNRHRDAWDGWG